RTPKMREIAMQILENNRIHSSANSAIIADAQNDPIKAWLAKRALINIFDNETVGKDALTDIKKSMEKREAELQICEIEKQIQSAYLAGDNMMILTLQRKKTELKKEIVTQA
ncbi:MAG: hypothetical protein JXR91_12265, partial [Deltaproteobacteria bacterium]|nr:hypothetical protein [Deltaproteobacteria bacterium]